MIFLANENFPFSSIRILREKGYSVKSILEEFAGISDAEVIKIEQKDKAIILIFDRDYGEIIVRHSVENPPAIIYFRLIGKTPSEAANLLLTVIEQGISLENRFTVIEQNNIRQRKY